MRFVDKEKVVGKGVGGQVGPEGPKKVGDPFGRSFLLRCVS